ncbi:unnamed protein product [Lupinus luteus]|uniref:Amino acid transporter transmembrane domain-containing protein n=1 Tax=Lupinus luteus TaxID=3873 RepID=A0AAV1YGR1_LUPLU
MVESQVIANEDVSLLDDDGKSKRTGGGKMYILCGVIQYCNLAGAAIGYTITTSISALAIRKINCFHKNGVDAECNFSNNPYMIGLGIVEIILSQIPNFHNLAWLSILAAIMSFGYAFISIGLSLATIIQETPGSILMGSGFRNPFWLIDIANVICQPIFGIVETLAGKRWPDSSFIKREYHMRICNIKFSINIFRLVWRTMFVVVVTVLAMAMPFFNEMLALLGAMAFWPLVIYFPIQVVIAKEKVKKGTLRWFWLQTLNLVFLMVSLGAACAAVHGLNKAVHQFKPFMYKA